MCALNYPLLPKKSFLLSFCRNDGNKQLCKPLRILAMIGIGIVLALIFYAIGLPQKSIGPLTSGILFFIWPRWVEVGGKINKQVYLLHNSLKSSTFAAK